MSHFKRKDQKERIKRKNKSKSCWKLTKQKQEILPKRKLCRSRPQKRNVRKNMSNKPQTRKVTPKRVIDSRDRQRPAVWLASCFSQKQHITGRLGLYKNHSTFHRVTLRILQKARIFPLFSFTPAHILLRTFTRAGRDVSRPRRWKEIKDPVIISSCQRPRAADSLLDNIDYSAKHDTNRARSVCVPLSRPMPAQCPPTGRAPQSARAPPAAPRAGPAEPLVRVGHRTHLAFRLFLLYLLLFLLQKQQP